MKNSVIVSIFVIFIVYNVYNTFFKNNNTIKDISNMEILAITITNHEGKRAVIMNECVSPNENINDPNLYNYELKDKVNDLFESLVVNYNYTVEGSNKYNVNAYVIGVDVIYNSNLETIYIYFRDDHDSIHMLSNSPESFVIESYDEELLSSILRTVTSEINREFSFATEYCKH